MPIDPRGRICDWITSAYSADYKLYTDSEDTVKLHWYFVPETNPTLNIPTPFASRAWEAKEDDPELGEQVSTRVWSNGQALNTINASEPLGSVDQWENGFSVNDKATIPPLIVNFAGVVPITCPSAVPLQGDIELPHFDGCKHHLVLEGFITGPSCNLKSITATPLPGSNYRLSIQRNMTPTLETIYIGPIIVGPLKEEITLFRLLPGNSFSWPTTIKIRPKALPE